MSFTSPKPSSRPPVRLGRGYHGWPTLRSCDYKTRDKTGDAKPYDYSAGSARIRTRVKESCMVWDSSGGSGQYRSIYPLTETIASSIISISTKLKSPLSWLPLRTLDILFGYATLSQQAFYSSLGPFEPFREQPVC